MDITYSENPFILDLNCSAQTAPGGLPFNLISRQGAKPGEEYGGGMDLAGYLSFAMVFLAPFSERGVLIPLIPKGIKQVSFSCQPWKFR